MRNIPQEFCTHRTQFENAASQCFSLHQGRRVGQFVSPQVSACNAHRHCGLTRWNDHADAAVPASAHRTASRVHQEGNQEAEEILRTNFTFGFTTRRVASSGRLQKNCIMWRLLTRDAQSRSILRIQSMCVLDIIFVKRARDIVSSNY